MLSLDVVVDAGRCEQIALFVDDGYVLLQAVSVELPKVHWVIALLCCVCTHNLG